MSTGMVAIETTAQDGDQQRHDDERVGAPKREPDDPHSSDPESNPNSHTVAITTRESWRVSE